MLVKLTINIFISVEPLPSTHHSDFHGARILPSLAGNGAILQHKEHLYELMCNIRSCNWRVMEQTLKKPVRSAVMMYLPPGFARENCLSDGCPAG